MSYFTDSPFERMMQDATREAPERPAPPPEGHPCYGCGNYPGPCVSCWKKALASWQAEHTEQAALCAACSSKTNVYQRIK